jgi:hypothetical protein
LAWMQSKPTSIIGLQELIYTTHLIFIALSE